MCVCGNMYYKDYYRSTDNKYDDIVIVIKTIESSLGWLYVCSGLCWTCEMQVTYSWRLCLGCPVLFKSEKVTNKLNGVYKISKWQVKEW